MTTTTPPAPRTITDPAAPTRRLRVALTALAGVSSLLTGLNAQIRAAAQAAVAAQRPGRFRRGLHLLRRQRHQREADGARAR